MKNRKEWWKKNQVFFLITLIVLLTAGISLNLDVIGKNPIEKCRRYYTIRYRYIREQSISIT